MKTNPRQVFNKRSDTYNELLWVYDKNFGDQIVQFVNPTREKCALDLGTGSGAIVYFLQEHLRYMVALDISNRMLKNAIKYIRYLSNVYLIIANGESLPFVDGCYDLVLCRNSLHHFLNPLHGLKEVARVTKKSGAFVLIEPVAPCAEAKKLWATLFRIRDKGRHRSFYFTQNALVEYVEKHFHVVETKSIVLALPMRNWLNTSCVTRCEKQRIETLIEQASLTLKTALGIYQEGQDWVMCHTWAMVKMKKERQ